MSKELFMSVYDEIYQAAIDEGLSDADAHHRAESLAWEESRERLFDMADNLRKIAKENK